MIATSSGARRITIASTGAAAAVVASGVVVLFVIVSVSCSGGRQSPPGYTGVSFNGQNSSINRNSVMKSTIFASILAMLMIPTQGMALDLFIDVGDVPPDYSPEPGSWVSSKRPVTIAFDNLKQAPSELAIVIPEQVNELIDNTRFIYRSGFIYDDENGTIDCNQQLCDIIPDPTALPDEFSYRWFGSSNGFEISLTVENGRLLGIIEGNSGRWLLSADNFDDYYLEELDRSLAPPFDTADLLPNMARKVEKELPPLSISRVDVTDWEANIGSLEESKNSSRSITDNPIDILVLYTEQARIEAGGSSSNINDTADIELTIKASVDDLQSAFDISKMANISVGRIHIAKINGFSATGDSDADKLWLKNDSSVQSLRNNLGADIVSLIARNNTDLGYAGVAFAQRPGCDFSDPISDCGTGEDFSEYAVSIIAQNAAHTWYSFAHEVGHNLGGEHDWDIIQSQTNNQFTRENASLPYAFGHYATTQYKSLMAYPHGIPLPRWSLQISNPEVTFDGWITGVVDEADNAIAMQYWAPYVSAFRERPGDLSCSGFDVIHANRNYFYGDDITCRGENSFNSNNVSVENGATLEIISPYVKLLPEFRVYQGGSLHIFDQ